MRHIDRQRQWESAEWENAVEAYARKRAREEAALVAQLQEQRLGQEHDNRSQANDTLAEIAGVLFGVAMVAGAATHCVSAIQEFRNSLSD